MKAEHIIDEVIRYCDDNSYQYAVLIDGEWGCGKTYFIQHELTEAIEKKQKEKEAPKSVKYVSLYGCKSVSEVQEAIVWTFADEAGCYAANKAAPDSSERSKRIVGNMLSSSKKIMNAIREKYLPETKLFEIATDWITMKSYIFVFDDLERCDCAINELFGFINGLVEHEGTKVILVANEKEITHKEVSSQKELQYLLVLNDRIQWEEERKQYPDNHLEKVTPDQMEHYRQMVFGDGHSDTKYESIKEKLIGITLRYTPDIKHIVEALVSNGDFSERQQKLLHGELDYFYDTMDCYNRHNLRTFQFFLSRVTHLLCWAERAPFDDEYRDWIYQFIVRDSFRCAIEFKANFIPPTDWRERVRYDSIRKAPAIKKYIETGELNDFELVADFQELIDECLVNAVQDDDPAILLYNQYYYHNQQWCDSMITRIMEKLGRDAYPSHSYFKLLIVLQRLVDLGFSEEILDKAYALMIQNAEASTKLTVINNEPIFHEDEAFKAKIRKRVNALNHTIEQRNDRAIKGSVSEILKDDNWAVKLGSKVSELKNRYYHNFCVFCKADVSEWIECITKSSPEQIDAFRGVLDDAYPISSMRACKNFEDIPVLREIGDGLTPEKAEDLIVKANLSWLQGQIQKITELYHDTNEDNC